LKTKWREEERKETKEKRKRRKERERRKGEEAPANSLLNGPSAARAYEAPNELCSPFLFYFLFLRKVLLRRWGGVFLLSLASVAKCRKMVDFTHPPS
jgi:hypothetical protein